ncbi:hypothetical protein DKP78_12400 [Enterococcus faecium]|nr:hypothetical protein DKP78_12400 [Enterococcus faecium]
MDINNLTKGMETFISIIPFFTFIFLVGSSIQTYLFSDIFTKKFLTTNTIRFLGTIFDTIILLLCNLLFSFSLIMFIFSTLEINSQEIIKALYQKRLEFKEFFDLFSVVYIASFFLLVLIYTLTKEFTNTDKYLKKSNYYVLASDISFQLPIKKDTKLYLVQIHKNKECILVFWKNNNFNTLPNRIIVNYSELHNKIIYTESKDYFTQSLKKVIIDFHKKASIKNKITIIALVSVSLIIFYIFVLLVNNVEIVQNFVLLVMALVVSINFLKKIF